MPPLTLSRQTGPGSGAVLRRHLALEAEHITDDLGRGLELFLGNFLVDVDIGVKRPRNGRVLDNGNTVLFRHFTHFEGEKILALGDQYGCVHVVEIVFQGDKWVGLVMTPKLPAPPPSCVGASALRAWTAAALTMLKVLMTLSPQRAFPKSVSLAQHVDGAYQHAFGHLDNAEIGFVGLLRFAHIHHLGQQIDVRYRDISVLVGCRMLRVVFLIEFLLSDLDLVGLSDLDLVDLNLLGIEHPVQRIFE